MAIYVLATLISISLRIPVSAANESYGDGIIISFHITLDHRLGSRQQLKNHKSSEYQYLMEILKMKVD